MITSMLLNNAHKCESEITCFAMNLAFLDSIAANRHIEGYQESLPSLDLNYHQQPESFLCNYISSNERRKGESCIIQRIGGCPEILFCKDLTVSLLDFLL